MWASICERAVILVIVTSIALTRLCDGKQVNLTESCSGLQSNSCVLFDIPTSYGDPFVIADSANLDLRELILRNIVLVRFPREIFEFASNLHSLIMHNCGVYRISPIDFEHASKLRILILQRNRLSEISEKVFTAVPSLEELHLGQNNIHLVHQMAFTGLTQLSQLNLQQNAINQLGRNTFLPLTNLEYLDLSGNEISKIDASTFAANTKLTTLLLNNNKFVVFEPNSLEHLLNLRFLDVSNSFLEELNTQSVDTIYAQNSSLKRCNIRGYVIKLHVSNNELTSLSIADKASVLELVLHGNLFDSLNDFVEFVNLQHLDLSKNHISSLATSRSPLYLSFPNLSYLNLAFNKLKNLTFENLLILSKLTHLDIAFNHITTLDVGVFEPLRKLEKLFIDGNELQSFDYRKFYEAHHNIREIGLGANFWSPHHIKEMTGFFEQRSVQLVDMYTATLQKIYSTKLNPDTLQKYMNSSEGSSLSTHFQQAEMSQCISSNADIVSIATLILVFVIFALQIMRLSCENNCISLFWRRKSSRLRQQWLAEPLDESVSEV